MEREVGAQVAPPIFLHQPLPLRFCNPPTMTKKRDLPWQNPNFQHQQQLQFQHQQLLLLNSGFQNPNSNWNPNPSSNWNPKGWEWDSVRFLAKPSAAVETEQKKKGDETLKPLVLRKDNSDEDGGNLTLKLGGSVYSAGEPAVRPSKRVRSGSPGCGSYPMCQVDDCKGDLSNAKDYHRRHKVCELHSKMTQALVGQQMQRFCQQCSRFHPLLEFDEGKRSCRRRLAGHNRRRRKTQPEDVSARLQGSQENTGRGNLDIVNLLTILSHMQGNNVDKNANGTLTPDRERLIQILSKMKAQLPVSENSSARSPVPGRFDLNIAHPSQSCSENPSNVDPSPSATNLLDVFSAALAASSPEALAILSQASSDSSGDDKTTLNCLEQGDDFNLRKKPSPAFPPIGEERSNTMFRSPVEVSECPVQEVRSSLPLQLFSSPGDDTSPKLGSSRKYVSSDSSNPMEERSPSSSPPVVRKLFPLHSATELMKHERMAICGDDNVAIEASTSRGWSPHLDLFKGSNGRAESGAVSNLPYQAGYSSSSGSDHSPSSSNSDAQDRTGRIIFKLFDKDPSNFPGTLRNQILNWLSHSPSEMESYIRPGCVVLSVYVSMPSTAWEELQESLLQRVSSLVQDTDLDLWRNGRFLVQTDRQLASYKDGKVRLCKSWRTWRSPELVSVSPLAVMGGEETTLVLRGRNLSIPGTKIHCTFMGGYMSKEVPAASYLGAIYDDSSSETFHFAGGAPNVLGRCFIEVENGFKGNSFPLIIADASICRELRILESELEEDDQNQDFVQPRLRDDVLHFLNELGWLFQRKCIPGSPAGADFSTTRFKFLFTFSVERDWSAVVKTLLDILVERNSERDGLSSESLETLSEIHLLNRAVKRKCRKMIDLLLHYSVSCSISASKKYLFPPNLAGLGGVTPLHLAACTQDSEEIVDALTNDPQEIGLNCWNSVSDASGLSPFMYASMRKNHSYNRLVGRKLADRRNSQISITVSNDEISLDQLWIEAKKYNPNPEPFQVRTCARCAVSLTRCSKRPPGTQGLLYRPYVHSMLVIAAVCVCVCLFLRGLPDIGDVAPFKWENVGYGSC
ncbi:squamosa promoter-binding-like protein 15 [Tasmannia lanceolata]|uniref:squamosa promoter-binding-like protein 15 n=1 Tax=Tasmannia lanceolata TaxID=3420 RepID=UPI004064C050